MKLVPGFIASTRRLAILLLALGLLGAISYLVVVQVRAQVALQQSALNQVALDSERRATALGYFFSEQKDFLKDLAESRAIQAYFENRALGMSLTYGLQASRVGVDERFDQVRWAKKLGEQPLYERLVFVDSAGRLLGESPRVGARRNGGEDWRRFLSPRGSEPTILREGSGADLRILISAPCFFKGVYAGQLLGWISFPRIYQYFIEGRSEASRYPDAIVFGRDYLHIPRRARSMIPFGEATLPAAIQPGRYYEFPQAGAPQPELEAYSMLVPVKGTLFALLTFIPKAELGFRTPRQILYSAGGVALLLLTAIFTLVRLSTNNALLRSRLDETILRERAVDEKNRELAAEIRVRQAAEASLEKERDFIASLFETAQVIMLVLDRDGRIERLNPYLEGISGYRLEEVRGRDWFSVFLPEGQWERQRQAFVESLRDSKAHSRVHPILTKDQQLREIEWQQKALRDAGGDLVGLLSIGRDITDFARAEAEKARLSAELQQAQKMDSIGRLAGGVAHDFNNMLCVIIGHVDIAMECLEGSHPIQASLKEVSRAAHHSADLTRQLLAFAHKQTIAPRVLDLNETVEGMLRMLERLIGENIDLRWRPGVGLWPVKVDPSQIDQILANLSINARDAISDVGSLGIETENRSIPSGAAGPFPGVPPGDYVVLAVSDNGEGMAPEILPRIFEPFFTTKGLGQGTGLGLATVYGIVTQNSGFIHVESEQGTGTTFRIFLPRHAGEFQRPMKKAIPGESRPGRETVLLVEDEPVLLDLTRQMVEMQGYTVLATHSPSEALRLSETHAGHTHLLLTDVVMPEMNGKDLADKLRARNPELKCLFMSGYPAEMIAEHGVLGEGVHFLQKPYTAQVLSKKMREVLDLKD